MAASTIRSSTSGRLLFRNTLWNLAGQGGPLLVALFAIPILIRDLGTDRFGILTLAWVIIGYFSLFDLGLGRALTQLVAQRLARSEDVEGLPTLIWTSLSLMFALGLLGAAIVALLAPWLVHNILKIPVLLQPESLAAFYLLAASIPVVIVTTGFRGVLEAQQRFDLSNSVRVPMGIFTYVGPVVVLPFSRNLFWIVAALFVGRVVGCLVYAGVSFRVTPGRVGRLGTDPGVVGPLLRFGGWMTVSNVVGPLMTYMDRLLISALISVTAVAYYATPYEMVTKLVVVAVALAGVLFPAFAASFAADRRRARILFERAVKYLFLLLFPATLVIVTLAPEGVTVWLGKGFAAHSTHVLQWLAAGVLFNSMAQVPFALIQGAGKAGWTAKLHLAEIPFYLAGLWWLLGILGIEGAAIAWAARTGIDMIALFVMAHSLIHGGTRSLLAKGLILAAALVMLTLAAQPFILAARMLLLLAALLGFALVAWFRFLSPEERALGGTGFIFGRVMS